MNYAKVEFTLSRVIWLRDGLRYRRVDSRSVCPMYICTVRMSIRFHKCQVANVARNLCR